MPYGAFPGAPPGAVAGAPAQPLSFQQFAPQAAAPVAPPILASYPVVNNMLGMLVAGRPVTTEFRAISADKLVAEVPAPGQVAELSVFLLPGVQLPPDKGIVVYYAMPPFADWCALGVLHAGRPSAVFRTGWPSTPEIAHAAVVQVGLSVEPLDTVANLAAGQAAHEWDKLGFAQHVARDLFTYLGSFSQMIPTYGERLVIPADALDRWLRRFEDKFRRDPNFLLQRGAAGGGGAA